MMIRGKSCGQGRTHANFPAVCFVTAAAMPPLSLACFLSFFEAGERVMVSSPGEQKGAGCRTGVKDQARSRGGIGDRQVQVGGTMGEGT